MAGLPECVVNTISVPPPETTQDKTQTKNTRPVPGLKLKFLIPPVIEPGTPRLVGRQGLYRPRHGDGLHSFIDIKITNNTISSK